MNKGNFVIAAIKQFFVTSVFLLFQIVIFILFSGYLINPRSLFYFAIAFGHYIVSIVILFKLNPELLVQRLKWKREGSKLWDEILMRLNNLTVIVLIPVIAGLDFRFSSILLDAMFMWIGLIFAIASTIFLNWAMIVNPHFEPTVRIQKERNHVIVRNGPYNIVRHPGYLAGILFVISIPFLIGSRFAFFAVLVYVILVTLRTWLEDKTLQEELEGYLEYVRQVRYRLFSGIW